MPTSLTWKKALGWGLFLWLIGYLLGIVLFMLIPPAYLGWVITPIGVLITIWVLLKKFPLTTLKDYFKLGLIWTLIAIILDYFMIVKLLKSGESYYKPDVYVYYLLTLILPVIVGWYKLKPKK